MRRIPLEEARSVPVFKNIVYAVRLVWKCDKRLMIGHMLNSITAFLFGNFIQNILFLKVLLGIFDGDGDFREYFHIVLYFKVLRFKVFNCFIMIQLLIFY